MSYISLASGAYGTPRPSQWTVRDRLRNITRSLTGGSSLDLRWIERFFYRADTDRLYPAMELMATHSRPSKAWYPNWSGVSGDAAGRLIEYDVDQRRYGDYGTLDEAAATNLVRNPRCEGAVPGVVGSGGQLPTHWAVSGGGTCEVINSGTALGWMYADVRFTGSGAEDDVGVCLEDIDQIAASQLAPVTASVGCQIVGGDETSLSDYALRIRERETGVGWGTDHEKSLSAGTFDTASNRRVTYTATPADAATDAVAVYLQMHFTGAYDITLRIFVPQVEQSASATSPVLPDKLAPGSATRAADSVTGVTVSRPSRGTCLDWDFSSGSVVGELTEFRPGQPRVCARGLLVEAAATNHIRNPYFEGATPGTLGAGGVLPTNMGLTDGGMTWELDEVGTEAGSRYLQFTLSGTGSADARLDLEPFGQVAAGGGDDWCLSAGVRVLEGELPGTLKMWVGGMTAGGAPSSSGGLETVPVTPDGQHRRYALPYTLADDLDTSAYVRPSLYLDSPSGSVSCTFRIYTPQLENTGYPTSPVLPSEGSPAAATRAADVITMSLGDWFNATGFSFVVEGVVGRLLPSQDARLVSLDNGTSANRVNCQVDPSGGPELFMASGGATQVNVGDALGLASGDTVRLAVGAAADDTAISYNGGTQDTDNSVTLPSGLTTLRIGDWHSTTERQFGGWLTRLRFWPHRLSNSELETLVGNS